uniref:Uncharacterized protein n=1 Tax=Pseudomonas marincola TaxID=437900 RepID=A0A653E1U6_9PSED
MISLGCGEQFHRLKAMLDRNRVLSVERVKQITIKGDSCELCAMTRSIRKTPVVVDGVEVIRVNVLS